MKRTKRFKRWKQCECKGFFSAFKSWCVTIDPPKVTEERKSSHCAWETGISENFSSGTIKRRSLSSCRKKNYSLWLFGTLCNLASHQYSLICYRLQSLSLFYFWDTWEKRLCLNRLDCSHNRQAAVRSMFSVKIRQEKTTKQIKKQNKNQPHHEIRMKVREGDDSDLCPIQ